MQEHQRALGPDINRGRDPWGRDSERCVLCWQDSRSCCCSAEEQDCPHWRARMAAVARQDRAATVRAARERLGLTQAQLAARLGVDVGTVSRWERGVVQPRRRDMEALAAMLASAEREE